MKKSVKTAELFDCETEYLKSLFEESVFPWDILPKIKEYIKKLIDRGIEGYRELSDGILVGEGVSISNTATILPPAIIGSGTEIRPGAYIRGCVITGEGCVIGNSSELKNCVLLDKVQLPHYNYVGDSILGNKTHLGAGSICSNLKSDGKAVTVHADTEYNTGLRKMGAILADFADVGCGCVLNPGTVIGKRTRVYPLCSLRGVYPALCIIKSGENYVAIQPDR